MKPKLAVILFVISSFISLIFLYYRRPDAFRTPQFYAEDATIFFTQAYYEGFTSIDNIYSGYLHTYERITAILLEYSGIGYQHFPMLYILAWMLPLFYSIWLLISRSGFKPFTALIVSLLPALIPVHTEAILNLTNVQWILCTCAAIIAFSKPPSNWFLRIIDLIFIMLAVTSSPVSVFILFIFLYGRFTLKHHPSYLITAFVGTVIQVLSMLKSARYTSHSLPFESWFLKANRYVFNQFTYPFVGFKEVYRPDMFYYIFSIVLIIILVFTGIYLWSKKNHAGVVCFFMLLATMSLNIFASVKTFQTIHPMFGNMRYFYLPTFFLLMMIFFVLKDTKLRTIFIPVILVWITCINVYVYKRMVYPDLGWKQQAIMLQNKQKISAPILPGLFWKVELDPAFHRK